MKDQPLLTPRGSFNIRAIQTVPGALDGASDDHFAATVPQALIQDKSKNKHSTALFVTVTAQIGLFWGLKKLMESGGRSIFYAHDWFHLVYLAFVFVPPSLMLWGCYKAVAVNTNSKLGLFAAIFGGLFMLAPFVCLSFILALLANIR